MKDLVETVFLYVGGIISCAAGFAAVCWLLYFASFLITMPLQLLWERVRMFRVLYCVGMALVKPESWERAQQSPTFREVLGEGFVPWFTKRPALFKRRGKK